jgi:RepB DNA-primase from phage plasmid/CHC2 zinc finger
LWVDADSAESVDELIRFEPAPTLLVWSGSGGAHAYWRLRGPVSAADGERAKRRLAHHLGADTSAIDCARILRPPGTLNHKHDPPKPVTLDRWRGDIYPLHDVVGELEDPLAEKRITAAPRNGDVSHLDRIPPAVYVEALTGQEVGRGGKIVCPFHDDTDPSLHVYGAPEEGWFCFGCRRGGSIIDFAAELWKINPRGRGYKQLENLLTERFLWTPHR